MKNTEHKARWIEARKILEEAFGKVKDIGFEPSSEVDLDSVEFFSPADDVHVIPFMPVKKDAKQ
jgi:hypothetical protein